MAWYTIETRHNYEAKVIEGINNKAEEGLFEVEEVFSPTDTVVEYKDGKKIEKQKRVYSKYIFVNMNLNDKIVHEIRKIPGVVQFVGFNGRPVQLTLKEIEAMKIKATDVKPVPKVIYETGVAVRIKDGSFKDFTGVVKSVEYEKNKATISVTVFNRDTDIEVTLDSIELT